MPRGENKSFVDQMGKVARLPGKDVSRRVDGKFDTPRAQLGRENALKILNDPKYQENLLKRMQAGEAGAIEVWVWRYGYGEPKKDDEEGEAQRQRFDAIRAEVREYLRRAPEQAHVLDAAAQRAPRILPRPQLIDVTPKEEYRSPSIEGIRERGLEKDDETG